MSLVKKNIEGVGMWLDPDNPGISRELIRKGGREFAFMWILRQESKHCDYGLDIGANIGYCTMVLNRNCKLVYAFEPDKRSRDVLKRNLGKQADVYISSSIVSSQCGELRFKHSKKPNQSSVSSKGPKIQAISLDSFPDFAGSLFLKMDVEGHEIEVIQGAHRQLEMDYPRKLLIELHKQKDRTYTSTWEWLKSVGYRLKYVVNAKGMKDKMQGEPVYAPDNYERAAYNAFDGCEEMCSKAIGGKKIIRSVLWTKE